MTSQIKSHDPITTRQRRQPLKPAPGIAHCRVQEKDRVGLTPRIGKIVDVIGKLKSVRRAEGAVHLFFVPGRRILRAAGDLRVGFTTGQVLTPAAPSPGQNEIADCDASFDLDVGVVDHRRPLLNECVSLRIDLLRRVCDWGESQVGKLLLVFRIMKRLREGAVQLIDN